MKSHLIAVAAAIIALAGTANAPAAAQGGGKQNACRQETIEACVKRQMAMRDSVSGVAIQRGDAERFCNRRSRRC